MRDVRVGGGRRRVRDVRVGGVRMRDVGGGRRNGWEREKIKLSSQPRAHMSSSSNSPASPVRMLALCPQVFL